ncbi:magnesium transporter CorA family protein [Erysipelotrichaceae bacterium RD49]|nr:magnesium transporter CorA family protein [Erysipelotrichaceae bacterium RD49]
MISYFKTDNDGMLILLEKPQQGCWISVVSPSAHEVERLLTEFDLLPEFIDAALDEQESSYIDKDEERNQTLAIVDYPEEDDDSDWDIDTFITLPIGIIFTENYLFTICTRENSTVERMEMGQVKDLDTRYRTRFLLNVLLLISQEYLADLRQIERLTESTEKKLYSKMQNKELIDILVLSKSLIYFSTSLKAEQMTLEKVMRSREIPMYEEDKELLEDVMIEIRQAIEMCNIYSDLTTKMTDGFSNVINNNMNIIMKRLTVITLVMSIPNMVYGFYGMNVSGLPFPAAWFAFLVSVVLVILAWLYFKHNSGYRS